MYVSNIEADTIKNTKYRKILYTKPDKFQLVIMNIKPKGEIPIEKHKDAVQFIRVEAGQCYIYCGKTKNNMSKRLLKPGMSAVIPNNYWHRLVNNADVDLKLYSIYTDKH